MPAFLVNLMVFTFVLLMARIMSLTDLVINKGVGPGVVFRIFFLVLPKMLSLAIPMSALLATLTTFLRLSVDMELTVIKSSGVSLLQLLTPVLLFGLAASILSGLFNLYLAPMANLRFRAEILTLAKARADLAIKEQVFVRDFPGLTIYVGQLPSNSETMSNVVINDKRSSFENSVIVARKGLLDIDPIENLLLFRLQEGVIDRIYTDKESVDTIFFDTYELKISPGQEFETEKNSTSLTRQDMPTELLLDEADYREKNSMGFVFVFRLEFYRRWAYSFAALLMSIIGMPLGASFRTKGRNFGLLIGLFIFVLYYTLLSLGWSFGETGSIPPFLAVWTPNILATALACWLLKGIDRTAAIDPQETIKRLWSAFRSSRPIAQRD
jgi:lipopolysaccharide export system permease protein